MHNDNLPESGPAGGRRKRWYARRSVPMSQHMLDQVSEFAAISRMEEGALTERERRRRN